MNEPVLAFEPYGPFDDEERAVVEELVEAVRDAHRPETDTLVEVVRHHVDLLHRLGGVLAAYPSPFAKQALGHRERSLETLVELLSHSNLSNFDMFLPTRAQLARTLAMAEVNFYRLLRFVCDEALEGDLARKYRSRIERALCECLYGRLTAQVLKHIASDRSVESKTREKAVLALSHVWENPTYRVKNFFPVLEATWEARRRVPVTLGSLMGTSEMFRLLAEGCDPRFVDFLIEPGHSEDEAEAFREFLFGSTTEKLHKLEILMARNGKHAIARAELDDDDDSPADLCSTEGDPAIALYEFFLSRHLQAGARRLNDLPGPKRTAEEYVMLRYLEQLPIEQLAPK